MTGAQKSILITGCSTGIGYDAAKGLKARGWQVFATCRQATDCARLRDEGFVSFPLDYNDPASITAAMAEVLKATGGTLDALFNNGAYAIPGAVEDIPRDAMRTIFDTNLIGVHDLTTRVLPVMRAQGHGRIVNCSSVLGLVAMPWRGAYNATKFALEGLTDTMRMELRKTGIHVVLIEPGPVTSDFRKNARKQFERWIDWENSALADLYRDSLIPRLNAAGEEKDTFELPASAVTAKLIHAVEAKRPHPRYFVTKPTYFADLIRRTLPTRLRDMILASN
jgi:NAD(P)-dependent dehydrogenase (short-subunit alcohol dehydrogenase family)